MKAHNRKAEADYLDRIYIMWHGAALTRTRKMPPLSAFTPKKKVKGIDEAAIKRGFEAIKRRFEQANGHKGKTIG